MNTDTTEKRPFLFDLDFGAPENQADDTPEVEQEPPPPTFSEEELQAAKQDGYNSGHADGIHEAVTGLEHRIAESLDVATTAFSRLAAAQETANKKTPLMGFVWPPRWWKKCCRNWCAATESRKSKPPSPTSWKTSSMYHP
jgi:hypothetical protein